MPRTKRHKVFISFHHEQDQKYKDRFIKMMGEDMVDKSVEDGDIDDDRLLTETIRQKIRDDFIAEATVTVVLVGPYTWQRKHVDWEIGSSLRDTKRNSRCGLLGILLPDHPNYKSENYKLSLVPPRLADNCRGNNPYANIHDWTNKITSIRSWIHHAFERRNGIPPDNSRPQFKNNRSGSCWKGWQN